MVQLKHAAVACSVGSFLSLAWSERRCACVCEYDLFMKILSVAHLCLVETQHASNNLAARYETAENTLLGAL